MQWIPAHVGIDESKIADALGIDVRIHNNDKLLCVITPIDINALPKLRLKDKAVKLRHQICEVDTNRTLTNILT